MGCWRYCQKCGSGMDSPTFREVIIGEQPCPQAPNCDWVHEVEQHEKDYAVDSFIERVERIEAHLGLSK